MRKPQNIAIGGLYLSLMNLCRQKLLQKSIQRGKLKGFLLKSRTRASSLLYLVQSSIKTVSRPITEEKEIREICTEICTVQLSFFAIAVML